MSRLAQVVPELHSRAPSADSPRVSSRLLGGWHLLSLDAPTVAALWTFFLARAAHVALPASAPIAMFLTVWIIYAADRLLDTRKHSRSPHRPPTPGDLEARHLFHHAHRGMFAVGIGAASLILLPLIFTMPSPTLHLYLLLGFVLSTWFSLIHLLFRNRSSRLPKELAVGLFFSAAIFIPTVSRHPSLRLSLVVPALLFALLVSLNCLFIFAWEHEYGSPSAHLTTRFAQQHLKLIGALTVLAPLALLLNFSAFYAIAISLAAALLVLLHHLRSHLDRTLLRAAADLALLTPLLVLPFLR